MLNCIVLLPVFHLFDRALLFCAQHAIALQTICPYIYFLCNILTVAFYIFEHLDFITFIKVFPSIQHVSSAHKKKHLLKESFLCLGNFFTLRFKLLSWLQLLRICFQRLPHSCIINQLISFLFWLMRIISQLSIINTKILIAVFIAIHSIPIVCLISYITIKKSPNWWLSISKKLKHSERYLIYVITHKCWILILFNFLHSFNIFWNIFQFIWYKFRWADIEINYLINWCDHL